MSKKDMTFEEYFDEHKLWHKELSLLREIILRCPFKEEMKWGAPCYTFQNSNVIILHRFKSYCGIGFFKGVLLKDESGILQSPGENSQSARVMHFTDVNEIKSMESQIIAYLNEAIEVEKAGLKIEMKQTSDYTIPDELQETFDKMPDFLTAFQALTPGRQRAYIIYFSQPKQAQSREARIEKYFDRIMDGKGINDCVCGLSHRFPACDGTHKTINS